MTHLTLKIEENTWAARNIQAVAEDEPPTATACARPTPKIGTSNLPGMESRRWRIFWRVGVGRRALRDSLSAVSGELELWLSPEIGIGVCWNRLAPILVIKAKRVQ